MLVNIQLIADGMLPETHGDAFDCFSREPFFLEFGRVSKVPLGFAIEVPVGYSLFIIPRSGLARKHGVTIVNSPGLVDSDCRAEVCAFMTTFLDTHDYIKFPKGTRVCQGIIMPTTAVSFELADELSETSKGSGKHLRTLEGALEDTNNRKIDTSGWPPILHGDR